MKPSVTELTRELVGFPTYSYPWEQPCTEHVGKILEEIGFTVRYFEYDHLRTSLIARYRGTSNRKPIAFTGHLDVVPLGITPWAHNPFAGELDGDRLYGRGSTDMKGGVAAFLRALMDVMELKPTVGITVIITAGEEVGCKGAAHLAAQAGKLGEAGALLVGEATENRPQLGHHGALWLNVLAKGVAAHASMPEAGVNAIYKAARAILELSTYDFPNSPTHCLHGPPTLNVGTIMGGMNINSVPDSASFNVDCRLPKGHDHELLLADLEKLLQKHELEFSKVTELEAVETDPQNEWVQRVFDIHEKATGQRAEPRHTPSVTDASCLTAAFDYAPTIILGPGEPTMAHKTDEYVKRPRLEQAVSLYERVLADWCGC